MALNYRSSMFVGLALIGLGVLFLLQQVFNWSLWDALWPFVVIAFGGLFFAGMVVGGKGAGPLAIPGSIITTIGLILFTVNLLDHWEAWAYAWGLIVAAVGLGLALNGWWSDLPGLRRSGLELARLGLTLFVVFALIFEVLIFGTFRVGSWFGPVLLIALGLWQLLRRSGLWERLFPPSAPPAVPAAQVTLEATGRPADDQSPSPR
jgi:hypothetical protein